MDLGQLFKSLRRRWVFIAAVTAIAVVVVAGISLLLPKQYEAEGRVFVSVSGASNVNELSQGSDFSEQRVRSYVTLATRSPVLDRVIEELDLDTNVTDLSKRVRAEVPSGTVLIAISATDSRPERAAQITNAVASSLIGTVESVERPSSSAAPLVSLSLVQPAVAPEHPSSPQPLRNSLLALVAGALIAAILAILRDSLDTRVRSSSEASRAAGAPLLVRVPYDAALAKRHVAIGAPQLAHVAEAYRLLRTRLRFANVDRNMHSVLVTSAAPGDGKTSASINLAAALAETGDRVLLVDADLRQPTVGTTLGLEDAVGLTTVLTDGVGLPEAIQHGPVDGLDVLTAGPLPPNPGEIMESQKMRALVAHCEDTYDFVIFDSPPAASLADAAILGSLASGVILVARGDGRTRREQLALARENVHAAGARVIGVIVNRARSDANGYEPYFRAAPGEAAATP